MLGIVRRNVHENGFGIRDAAFCNNSYGRHSGIDWYIGLVFLFNECCTCEVCDFIIIDGVFAIRVPDFVEAEERLGCGFGVLVEEVAKGSFDEVVAFFGVVGVGGLIS